MTPGKRLASVVAVGLLAACNVVDSEPAPATVDPEMQQLVGEIDALLAVPQDEYPQGDEVSYAFERVFDLVTRRPRTLRTDEIQKWLPWFIAHGHGLGWNAKQSDVERIAREWQGLRARLVDGG